MLIRIVVLSLFVAFAVVHATAQNLLPNGNFEQYTQCPSTTSQVDRCTGWRQFNKSTSDYMHACNPHSTGGSVDVPVNVFGTQMAASGDGYMGGYSCIANTSSQNLQYKEHIARQIPALIKGVEYEFSMSISLGDRSSFATDDLGVWFYDKGPTTTDTTYFLQAVPQISFRNYGPITDMTNWVRVSGILVTDSAYDNIVIGGFDSYSVINKTPVTPVNFSGVVYCYYYYDSAVLRLASNFMLNYADTFVCTGDSIDVPYTVLNNGFFQAGNVFTLQLSDAGGNFSSPMNIGSVISTSSGIVKGHIPYTLPAGTGYKLRLVSSNNKDTTVPSIDNIYISEVKAILTASITSPVCTGDSIVVEVSSVPPLGIYTWSGPALQSMTGQKLIVKNAQPSHSGRYVVFGEYAGCKGYDTVDLIVRQLPDVQASNNSPVCMGDTLMLHATSSVDSVLFNWTGPDGFNDSGAEVKITGMTVLNKGTYTVTTTVGKCKGAEQKVDIDVFSPLPEAGNLDTLCAQDELQLSVSVPYSDYRWQDGSTAPIYTVKQPGIYWISVTNKCGVFADTVEVTHNGCDCRAFVPSAFSPNNDGTNDKIKPILDCTVTEYRFIILNRFGETVFKSNTPDERWDGTYKGVPAELSTYFFVLKLRGGKQDKDFLFKGDITLIR